MVREIPMPCGKVVLVDDEDYPVLSRFSWYLNGKRRKYAVARYGRKGSVFLHSVVMGGKMADHIDNDPLNCQKSNLRHCRTQQNNCNVPKYHWKCGPVTSRYKGVCRTKGGKWAAKITHNRTAHDLGLYLCEVEAAAAYNAKAVELFGDFAWLNDVTHDGCGCGHAGNVRKPQSSRFRGVRWDKRSGNWRVVVCHAGQRFELGRFDDEITAAHAYNVKAREIWDDVAPQNDLPSAH